MWHYLTVYILACYVFLGYNKGYNQVEVSVIFGRIIPYLGSKTKRGI